MASPLAYGFKGIGQGLLTGQVMDTGLGPAPSGYGAEYDQLFANNPYRNLTYRRSAMQNFLGWLGFRTDYDRWKEDAQVNANEYDAGIYEMMQQNQFNSPEAQASRMRDAGMNPDLLGIGDVANGASPNEDPNGMSQNVGDEFMDFGNSMVSIFSRAMAIVKDFKSLEQMNTIIDSQNTDNAVKMIGAIDSFIESNLSAEDLADMVNYTNKINSLSESVSGDESLPYDQSQVAELGFSERQRKQYYSLMRSRLLSMSTDKKAYEMFKNRIDAMSGSKESLTNPFAFNSEGSESAVDILVKGLTKAHKKALEFGAQAQASQSVVSAQEFNTLETMNGGISSAKAQISEYDSKKTISQWNKECARIKKDMIEQLEKSALAGDMLSKAMLMSWSLDDIAKLNVNTSANLGLNFGLGLSF